MALLDAHLIDRILGDFDRCGLVGEETNKLVGDVYKRQAVARAKQASNNAFSAG